MSCFDTHTHSPKENSIVNCFATDPIPNQWFSVGIHPWKLECIEHQKKELLEKSKHPNCKAIGECGFDRLCGTSMDEQNNVFDFQLELAHLLQKPIIVHCVRAFDLLLPKLKNVSVPIIVHGFNQNSNILNQLMAIKNVYFSFGHAVLNPQSNAQKAIQILPLQRFFLETDDFPNKNIEGIYTTVAHILGLNINKLVQEMEENKGRLFV